MKDDEAHPVENASMDALDDLVTHLGVRDVPPPCQHVGLGKDVISEAMVRFVERGRSHLEPCVAQSLGDGRVDAVRIDRRDRRIASLLAVFSPDGDARHEPVWLSGIAPATLPASVVAMGTALASVTTAPPF